MNFNLSFSLENKTGDNLLDQDKVYDLLIIGAGPAGLNAALYAKRKGLDTAIISKKKGGQILDTASVDNYLGLHDISGEKLAEEFLEHVSKLEVPILENAEIVDYFSEGLKHSIVLSTGEVYKSKTLLIATGSKPRKLSIPGEIEYTGRGVSYCAICDGPLFKGKDVFVAGGGNSAVEAAIDMSKFASSVTLIHRSEFRADKILLDRFYNNPKITVYLKTKILEILGGDTMSGVLIQNADTKEQYLLKGEGIFIEIGHIPNTAPFDKVLKLNEKGEIITNDKKETSVPGIYAAGDVTDSLYKQIIISASDGAVAALSVSDYINQNKF